MTWGSARAIRECSSIVVLSPGSALAHHMQKHMADSRTGSRFCWLERTGFGRGTDLARRLSVGEKRCSQAGLAGRDGATG